MIISVNKEFEPYFKEDISNEDYHGDKTAVSSTHLRNLLKSPSTFYHNWTTPPKEPTKDMRFGTIVHMAILEGPRFLDLLTVMPEFGDLRTTKNKQAKAVWEMEVTPGAVIVTEQELEHVNGIMDAFIANNEAFNLIKNGKTELSGWYADPETGIVCRVRDDYLSFDSSILLDLKTTIDCSFESFMKTIWEYRYDFQMAQYKEGSQLITGRKIEDVVFFAVEKVPPYENAIYIADDRLLDIGSYDYHYSLRLLKKCLEKRDWPRGQKTMQTISLPHWAVNKGFYE